MRLRRTQSGEPNPERYARIKEIYLTASRLAPDERDAYLARACASDHALREEVRSLLGHGDAPASFVRTTGLDALIPDHAGRRDAAPGRPPIPSTVGPFSILSVLGEGGMGVVYRARQDRPIRREVALKVVGAGLGSADVVARFDAERQTLASLDHPNIAKVLDAGTDERGQPYFVMELVLGAPITEFANSSGLSTTDRVRLALTLVRAIAHAHRRGVIHRDVKPSNVLVTSVQGTAVPKVIDFGVAKALSGTTLETSFRTRVGQVVGTLEYMSPEQARGDLEAIDVRTDVYSMGALLYELLSGRLPVPVAGEPIHEAVRRIHETPPMPLRQAAGSGTRRVDPDLDTVVAKCLEKDPDRRYGSAGELADDLERFLESRPVLARPPSTVYQLRKLVRRNRIAFSFAALVFAFLVAFSVTVSVQLARQRVERERAEAQARRAERTSQFLTDLLRSPNSESQGRDAKVADLLDTAVTKVRETAGEDPEVDADLLLALSDAYQALDLLDESEGLRRDHYELRRRYLAEDQEALAQARMAIVETHFYQARYDEVITGAREVLEMVRGASQPNPGLRGSAGNALGLALRQQGRFEESVAAFEDALDAYAELPPDEARRESCNAFENLAGTLLHMGDFDGAEKYVRQTLEFKREIGSQRGVATSLHNLGFVLRAQGKYEEALALQLESVGLERELLGKTGLAEALHGIAQTYLQMDRLADAEQAICEADSILEALGGVPVLLGQTLCLRGEIRLARGYPREAEGYEQDAEALLRGVLDDSNSWIARVEAARGSALAAQSRWQESEVASNEAISIARAGEDATLLHSVQVDAARAAAARGDFDTARKLLDVALDPWLEETGERHASVLSARTFDAWVRLCQGNRESASARLSDVLEAALAGLGPRHGVVAEIERDQALCHLAAGDAARARESAARSVALERDLLRSDHPRIAQSLWVLAWAQLEAGDPTSAEAAATEALEILRAGESAPAELVANGVVVQWLAHAAADGMEGRPLPDDVRELATTGGIPRFLATRTRERLDAATLLHASAD